MRIAWALLIACGCGRIGFEGPGREHFMSPTGDDHALGTRSAPWRTFGFALHQLLPGDTLTLLDGDYDIATTTRLAVNCNADNLNGTADAPVVVRADHPRRAHLFNSTVAVEIDSCSYWELDDLWIEAMDANTGPKGGVVDIYQSDHVTLRGLLVDHVNRYGNYNGIEVAESTNVTVDDCEVYQFHRAAYSIYLSHNVAMHRDYASGASYPDIPGGYPSVCPGGDVGVSSYYASDVTIDDSIVEQTCEIGFSINAGREETGDNGWGDRHTLTNDIALGPTQYGFCVFSDCDAVSPCATPDSTVSDNTISNSVAISAGVGFDLAGQRNRIDHVTALSRATDVGASLYVNLPAGGLSATGFISDSDFVGGAEGVDESGQTDWSVMRTNVFGAGTAFNPNDAHVMNATTIDPQLGSCLVYIPPTSPMASMNIGADIRTFLTCGAIVPGVNDDPATSCSGVHDRLHVGTMGCPPP